MPELFLVLLIIFRPKKEERVLPKKSLRPRIKNNEEQFHHLLIIIQPRIHDIAKSSARVCESKYEVRAFDSIVSNLASLYAPKLQNCQTCAGSITQQPPYGLASQSIAYTEYALRETYDMSFTKFAFYQ